VVLKALEESGPSSLSDLSARVGVEANTLSPLLKRLSEFGLIERVRDKRDERRVVLDLLPFGRDVLAEADRVASEGWEALGVNDDEIAETLQTLGKLRKAIDAADPPKMVRPEPPDADAG